MEKVFTLRELSRAINLNYHSLRRWCHTGRVAYSRTPGGIICMTETQVNRMLEQMGQINDIATATKSH